MILIFYVANCNSHYHPGSFGYYPCMEPAEVLLGGRFMEILAKSKTTQSLHEISAKRCAKWIAVAGMLNGDGKLG